MTSQNVQAVQNIVETDNQATLQIFTSREEAAKANTQNNNVIVSTQLRNPVRYPSILLSAETFLGVNQVPEQYKEVLRACLISAAEGVLKTAIKDNQTTISAELLTETALLSDATQRASASLTKEEYAAAMRTSAIGQRIAAVAKTHPATAQKWFNLLLACFSPRACNLSEADLVMVIERLSKAEYASDADSAWYAQALRTIETVQTKRANAGGADEMI